MYRMVAALVIGMALLATPAFAQTQGKPLKTRGTRGALIGAAAGGGAAAVYGLKTDYCRNKFGDYSGAEQAKFCAAPVAGMIGTGAVTGHLIGRRAVRPVPRAAGNSSHAGSPRERPSDIVPMMRLAQPPRAPRMGDRLFRELFIASPGAR